MYYVVRRNIKGGRGTSYTIFPIFTPQCFFSSSVLSKSRDINSNSYFCIFIWLSVLDDCLHEYLKCPIYSSIQNFIYL